MGETSGGVEPMIQRRLTEDDRKQLREIHRELLDLTSRVLERLVVDESDNHGNSWWRHYEDEVAAHMARVKHAILRYRSDEQPDEGDK